MSSETSLKDFLESLAYIEGKRKKLDIAALFPTDVFLFAAAALNDAGAFSHFDPSPEAAVAHSFPATFGISSSDKNEAISVGQVWRKSLESNPLASPPSEVANRLEELVGKHGKAPLRTRADYKPEPRWWPIALFILIASDEACEGIYNLSTEISHEYIKNLHFKVFYDVRQQSAEDHVEHYATGLFRIANGSASTFSPRAKKDKYNVFPKLNVSELGCHNKNFSKNLSLLPGTGTVRCHWHQPTAPLTNDDENVLNIILIPFPFKFTYDTFVPEPSHTYGSDQYQNFGWGNFSINQSCYEDHQSLQDTVSKLTINAKKDGMTINGIILQEYSTNFDRFHSICNDIKQHIEPKLEFVIAGTNTNRKSERGNFAVTAMFSGGSEEGGDNSEFQLISSRRKHHRWRLTDAQIDNYALSATLDPRKSWWEKHSPGFRELHFYPFRANSVFTSLICEDLARIDPCHEVLKNIGPNLVFSLLMDGPQLASRWPSRYARGLAEDIGCSVLTVTSHALIDRANNTARYPKSDIVASFASPFGVEEIKMPFSAGARGILLTLVSQPAAPQETIDGRSKPRRIWRLSHSWPLGLT